VEAAAAVVGFPPVVAVEGAESPAAVVEPVPVAVEAAAAVVGFPPVVAVEGAESPAAVVEVEFPVPAAALCDITTQLPKPDPEMNCYESRPISKQRLNVSCKLTARHLLPAPVHVVLGGS
jgi:hypothetical protein